MVCARACGARVCFDEKNDLLCFLIVHLMDGIDIALKFDELFKSLCDEKLTTAKAAEAPITAWRRVHLAGNDDPRVTALFDYALPSMMARLAELDQSRRVVRVRAAFGADSKTKQTHTRR